MYRCTRVTTIIKNGDGERCSLLIPPRYSSQGLFLISQTIRNDGALSFIVCAKKTKIYTARNKGRKASRYVTFPLPPTHKFSRLNSVRGFYCSVSRVYTIWSVMSGFLTDVLIFLLILCSLVYAVRSQTNELVITKKYF